MPDAQTFWQTLYERFDPEDPVTDPAWRAPREYSPALEILEGLRRRFGEKKYLFYGGVGAGKSTELLHIAEQRAADNFVVFVDLDRHFSTVIGDPDALRHIQAWEVMVLIALGVIRATTEKLGHEWAPEHTEPLRKAIVALTSKDPSSAKLDVMKLASTVTVFAGGVAAATAGVDPLTGAAIVGKGVELLGQAVGAGSWNLRLGRRKRVDDQDERASALLLAVNDILRFVRAEYREVTVLVDGLDRLEQLEPIEALFVRSRLLSELDAPTVTTGPIELFHTGISKRIRGFTQLYLASIPVLDDDDPSKPSNSVSVCVDAYRLRSRDLDPTGARFDDAWLERLAYYSGGVMRDFMHLIRGVAEQAWDRSLEAADEVTVDTAIDKRRRLYEQGLNTRDKALLREIGRSRDLPDDDAVPHLLQNWWLLPYPNDSVWWQPHPLLLISALAGAGAA